MEPRDSSSASSPQGPVPAGLCDPSPAAASSLSTAGAAGVPLVGPSRLSRPSMFALGRNLGLIAVSALFFNLSFSMHSGVFANFVVDDLRLGAAQVGFLEAAREFPGLLTVALAAVTFMLAESTLGGLCLLVSGLGLALMGGAGGFVPLLWTILLMSSGMHLFFPAQSALILHHSPEGRKAASLGAVNSAFAMGSLAGMAFVFFLARALSLRMVFMLCGLACAVGALPLFMLPREKAATRRRSFILRRRYTVYYLLTLLSGGRRHIFWTFARFALVQMFGLPVTTMVALQGAGSALSVVTRPLMGRIIDRFGERRTLVFNYSVLSVLYVGYAFVRYLPLVCAIFLLDQLFVDFDMAQTTYLDKVAAPEDLAPTLSTGGTINHIAGVSVPLLGGALWQAGGPIATFCGGALLAVAAAVVSSRIRVGPGAAACGGGAGRGAAPAGPVAAADTPGCRGVTAGEE